MTIPWSRLLLATEHTEFDVGAERVALELARRRGVPLAGVFPIVSNIEYESVAPELVAKMEAHVHARLVALQEDAARAGVVSSGPAGLGLFGAGQWRKRTRWF